MRMFRRKWSAVLGFLVCLTTFITYILADVLFEHEPTMNHLILQISSLSLFVSCLGLYVGFALKKAVYLLKTREELFKWGLLIVGFNIIGALLFYWEYSEDNRKPL